MLAIAVLLEAYLSYIYSNRLFYKDFLQPLKILLNVTLIDDWTVLSPDIKIMFSFNLLKAALYY